MARPGAFLLLAVAAALPGARGFYLPGSYPHKYNPGDYLNVDPDGGAPRLLRCRCRWRRGRGA